jgi:hypothetical protein
MENFVSSNHYSSNIICGHSENRQRIFKDVEHGIDFVVVGVEQFGSARVLVDGTSYILFGALTITKFFAFYELLSRANRNIVKQRFFRESLFASHRGIISGQVFCSVHVFIFPTLTSPISVCNSVFIAPR